MSELGFALLLYIAGHAVGDVVLQPPRLSHAKRPGTAASLPWWVAIGYHSIKAIAQEDPGQLVLELELEAA